MKRIDFGVDSQRQVVINAIPDTHQSVGDPVSQSILAQHRQSNVDVGLELDQSLPGIGYRPVVDAFELHAEALLERRRQALEVVAVHRKAVGMTGIADDLLSVAGDLAIDRGRPPSLHRPANGDQGPAVGWVPVLHRLQRRHNLVIVVAVVQG